MSPQNDAERDTRSEEALASQLPVEQWMVRCYHTVTSTMDIARALGSQADRSLLVLARCQSAGRGTHGRVWNGGEGEFFATYSVPVRGGATDAAPKLAGLSLVVGLVVAEALDECGFQVALKWPNDILSPRRKKLGGILIETNGASETLRLQIGIGINLNTSPHDLSTADSLLRAFGRAPTAIELAIALSERLRGGVVAAAQVGFAHYLPLWEARAAFIGETIRLQRDQNEVRCICRGVDSEGRLRVEVDGEQQSIATGRILLD